MSRYNSDKGGNGGDYDSTTLKLQKDAAVSLVPSGLSTNRHEQYGTSLISNFSSGEVLDGLVFQRDDKPQTVKVMSANKVGFHLNPEDGLVYEQFDDEEGEYENQMSAQDILDHPRVAGFSETFGGDDYFYTPVGVIVEEAGQIALNDAAIGDEDSDFLTDDEAADARESLRIPLGETSILEGNKTWTRTLAKYLSTMGGGIINDNGDDPTPRGEEDTNPKYDDHEWLATEEPELRPKLEGRTLELWITDEVSEIGGDRVEYTTPYLLDAKTSEFVQIDNDNSGSSDTSDTSDKAAAADGGTVTQDTTSGDTESPDEPSADDSGLPDGVPNSLSELIGYLARNNDEVSTTQVRDFAEDEVDDPDAIDWDAAAEVATERDG